VGATPWRFKSSPRHIKKRRPANTGRLFCIWRSAATISTEPGSRTEPSRCSPLPLDTHGCVHASEQAITSASGRATLHVVWLTYEVARTGVLGMLLVGSSRRIGRILYNGKGTEDTRFIVFSVPLMVIMEYSVMEHPMWSRSLLSVRYPEFRRGCHSGFRPERNA
jgi:hypothetical protein